MASTERGEDQAPATASGAGPAPPPSDESIPPPLEPLAITSVDNHPNGEHENGHAPAEDPIPAPAPGLPVRRARRVVVADSAPPPPGDLAPVAAAAGVGNPNGHDAPTGHPDREAPAATAPA